MHLAIAILAALVQRGRTGRGQLVEVAMQEAVLNLTRVKFTPTLASGKPLARTGNRSATGGYSDLIRCRGGGANDGVYLIIPPDNAEMFTAVTEVIGRPDLVADDRFARPAGRAANGAALTAIIEGWTRERDKRDVMQAFARKGIPCGAVLDTAEVLADPHLRERGTVFDLEHPTRGTYSMIGSPLRLSDSPFATAPAPLLGEHTEAVLTSTAGYTADEVRRLRDKRVI
jgi:formyl-CoA transferase